MKSVSSSYGEIYKLLDIKGKNTLSKSIPLAL
jgi:hypothetical protein